MKYKIDDENKKDLQKCMNFLSFSSVFFFYYTMSHVPCVSLFFCLRKYTSMF